MYITQSWVPTRFPQICCVHSMTVGHGQRPTYAAYQEDGQRIGDVCGACAEVDSVHVFRTVLRDEAQILRERARALEQLAEGPIAFVSGGPDHGALAFKRAMEG